MAKKNKREGHVGMIIWATLMKLVGANKHRDAMAFYPVRYLAC
jgi:hypothetical protein